MTGETYPAYVVAILIMVSCLFLPASCQSLKKGERAKDNRTSEESTATISEAAALSKERMVEEYPQGDTTGERPMAIVEDNRVERKIPTTSKYRATWVDDPATTMLLGWEQNRGEDPVVCYGTEDFGLNWEAYPLRQAPSSTERFMGMHTHFSALSGLEPNSTYYFVIKDSHGISRRMCFRTAPEDPTPFSFVFGGGVESSAVTIDDQLSNVCASNRTVATLDPLFVLFTGSYSKAMEKTEAFWQQWLDRWSTESSSEDGRLVPLLPVCGWPEQNSASALQRLFQSAHVTGEREGYFSLTFCGGLLHVIVLNSELDRSSKPFQHQRQWLEDELRRHQHDTFRIAVWNKSFWPHTKSKPDNVHLADAWAELFYRYGLAFGCTADADVHYITLPIRPGTGDSSYEGFVVDYERGTIYVGGGSWAGSYRPNDNDKLWTLDSGMVQQMKWFHVYPPTQEPQGPVIDMRTVVTGIEIPPSAEASVGIENPEGTAVLGGRMAPDVIENPGIRFRTIPYIGEALRYPLQPLTGDPPSRPIISSGRPLKNGGVEFSWRCMGNAARAVQIEHRIGDDDDWRLIESSIPAYRTTFTREALDVDSNHYFRLRVFNMFGFSDYSIILEFYPRSDED